MAQWAEQMGFASLWMRDIPFYDPRYGDVGQVFEPLVYISHRAAATQRSTLGTTGIVVPYSCAAWIASIHSGIDVARAAGLTHIAAATGSKNIIT